MEPTYPPITVRPQEDWPAPVRQPTPSPLRANLPAILFALTCLSTLDLGGPMYALALMSILLAHELGHYLQARRYGVPTSLPYFLPMPAILSPFGTMGAVLAMRPGSAHRRGLFDIAITGPLAGLLPSLAATVLGLLWSDVIPRTEEQTGATLGAPLLFRWLADALLEVPADHTILLHPLAYAGWVGLFHHRAQSAARGSARRWAYSFFSGAGALGPSRIVGRGFDCVVVDALGAILVVDLDADLVDVDRHASPAHRAGGEPIGWGRKLLGWATLASAALIFTPKPFQL